MIHENYGITMAKATQHSKPKGGMCINCKNRLEDCSDLDFDGMKTIDTHPLQTGGVINIVRCDSFTRI